MVVSGLRFYKQVISSGISKRAHHTSNVLGRKLLVAFEKICALAAFVNKP